MSTFVVRNPFARGEYPRECRPNADQHLECQWCGQSPGRLYTYVWQTDSVCRKTPPSRMLFCNLQCFRDYHN